MIFGGGSTYIKSIKIEDDDCPSCNTDNTLYLNVYSASTHIFWIPFCPTGKTATVSCKECELEMQVKDMPEELMEKSVNMKRKVSLPIWQYSGLILFLILMSWYYFFK